MNTRRFIVIVALVIAGKTAPVDAAVPYVVVGTGETKCYDNYGEIKPPQSGQAFYGQDAQFPGPQPSYRDNGDGTVSDLNTGLAWVQARGTKLTWDEAVAGATGCRAGGHGDWRVPTIKEVYSLINFTGECHGPEMASKPFIDTKYFQFAYGDRAKGERVIDCQDWSATEYLSTTMDGNPTVFGVNFADGRIKGYPKTMRRREGLMTNRLFVRYVRGNASYGKNDFRDNGDGTITDRATGLTWTKADSGQGMNWERALAYAAGLRVAGHADWRLPNAKELQSIVDYTRLAPAIDPVFQSSQLADGEYPYYWSSTTHLDGPPERLGGAAVYLCFGRGLGWMRIPPGMGEYRLLDVHGAGAQRSDPKVGDPGEFPHGRGPQGDVIRIFNYVRCVRVGIK
ncbi:MAG TPA: DUF1566 domain-containing protein [Verrucomicrobiae bacterium]|nr:DUF1566 domain-containing protein [Verrucomicrobiae bacterium]